MGREFTYLHECPVCGKGHRVNAVRHALAYGRQLRVRKPEKKEMEKTMNRTIFVALLLLATGEACRAEGNFDLPHSKEGVMKCWKRAHERYGSDIQSMKEKMTKEGPVVEFYINPVGGDEWILTCHPASGKLEPELNKKEH